jgi:predicted lipoprotein
MMRPIILLAAAGALAACGQAETPTAEPGAVERTTRELDRNAAAEMNAVIRKADREADVRADVAKQRIADSERARRRDD